MPFTHRKRRFCPAQIATRLACIEQYISTGYNLARRVSLAPRRSLAVCMPHMDKQCASFYVKDMSLNAEQQHFRCAWALDVALTASIHTSDAITSF